MERQTIITLENQVFQLDKGDDTWKLTVKRSDIGTQDLKQLELLSLHHPLFLEQDIDVTEDYVTFTYYPEEDGLSYETLKKEVLSNQLRFTLNVVEFEEALNLPLTFFLHPEMIFITKDSRVKLAYRGIPEIMVPKTIDVSDFLRQLKCFIISYFTEEDFMSLYDGVLEVIQVPPFLDAIRQAESIDQVRQELQVSYRQKIKEEEETQQVVLKSRYKLYKYASIWLTVAVVTLVLPLIYLVFIQNPFKEKLLDADTAYIKSDYTSLIEELEPIGLNRLPYTQKYELAYAYIQSQDLNEEQQQVILNNVTLKTDELYLDYWIQIGRGENEEAIDIAKRLDDIDLILYSLNARMEQVREDGTLSGSEREELLESLQSDYDKYWEDRSSSLVEIEEKVTEEATDEQVDEDEKETSDSTTTVAATSSETSKK